MLLNRKHKFHELKSVFSHIFSDIKVILCYSYIKLWSLLSLRTIKKVLGKDEYVSMKLRIYIFRVIGKTYKV